MRRCGAASGGLRRRHGPGASAPESNTRSATRRDDPVAQAVWWRTHLDVARLRLLAASGLGAVRWVMYVRHRKFRAMARERLGGPKRFGRAGARLLDRFGAGVARHPNATNPYAWRLFLGRECPAYRDPCSLPNPGAVRFLLGDVATHLQQVLPATYDAATLSNVLDGPGPATATASCAPPPPPPPPPSAPAAS